MDIFGRNKIKELEARNRLLIEDNAFLRNENDRLRNELAARQSPPSPAQTLGRYHRHSAQRPTNGTPDTSRFRETSVSPSTPVNDDIMGHVVTAAVVQSMTESAVSSCYDASPSSYSYSSSSSCDSSSSSSSSGGDF